MPLECGEVQRFWLDVYSWIHRLDYENYVLSSTKIILGDLDSQNKTINLIILYGKVYIHLAETKETFPYVFLLKNLHKESISNTEM